MGLICQISCIFKLLVNIPVTCKSVIQNTIIVYLTSVCMVELILRCQSWYHTEVKYFGLKAKSLSMLF